MTSSSPFRPPIEQEPSRLLDMRELSERVAQWRAQGQRTVLCHGCFDPLHYGHLLHFVEARGFGDRLLVTVTSDEYVSKGNGRPVFAAPQRAHLVGSLRQVDGVAISHCATACDALRILRPTVFVKGMDYLQSESPGYKLEIEVAQSLGIETALTKSAKYSATDLCQKQGWLAKTA